MGRVGGGAHPQPGWFGFFSPIFTLSFGVLGGPRGGAPTPKPGFFGFTQPLTHDKLGCGGGPPRGPHHTKGFSRRDPYN